VHPVSFNEELKGPVRVSVSVPYRRIL